MEQFIPFMCTSILWCIIEAVRAISLSMIDRTDLIIKIRSTTGENYRNANRAQMRISIRAHVFTLYARKIYSNVIWWGNLWNEAISIFLRCACSRRSKSRLPYVIRVQGGRTINACITRQEIYVFDIGCNRLISKRKWPIVIVRLYVLYNCAEYFIADRTSVYACGVFEETSDWV